MMRRWEKEEEEEEGEEEGGRGGGGGGGGGMKDNLSRSFRSFDPMVVSHPFQCALSSMTRSALRTEFLRLDGAVAVLILHYFYLFLLLPLLLLYRIYGHNRIRTQHQLETVCHYQ
jgi:hypothetical protein